MANGWRERRSRGLLLGCAAALAIFAFVVVAGARFARVAAQLEDARDALRRAEADVRGGRLASARSNLDSAGRLVADANGTLHTNPEVAALRWIPIARQNVDALRRSVRLALALTTGGRNVLAAAEPLQTPDGRLDVSLRGGAVPVDAVRDVHSALEEVAFDLPDTSANPTRWAIGPVRTLEKDVLDEAARRRAQFISVARGLEIVAEMSGGNGPRRYLIAVANAAEMRGTGGMILSYGELVSDAGKLALERFGPIDDLTPRSPPPPSAPYPERFEGYEPRSRWRNTNLTPDFTVVAPVQEQLYTHVTGKSVDGVIQIDSFGLAALLRITGPVAIPDAPPISAENVVPFTLNENYFRITNRAARQEAQGDVARAIFERLVSGEFPQIRDLGRVVADAARGRHVMVHSRSAATQRTIALLGADGGLPPLGNDLALLTVQNLSGTKLDYYLDTRLEIVGRRPAGVVSRIRYRVDLTNTARSTPGVPAVFGPISQDFVAGEYRGIVSVYLPLGANIRNTSGDAPLTPVDTVTELDRTVITYGVSIPAGGRHSLTFDVALPARAAQGHALDLVPIPRVRPTEVALNFDFGPGRVERVVSLRQPHTFTPAAPE